MPPEQLERLPDNGNQKRSDDEEQKYKIPLSGSYYLVA